MFDLAIEIVNMKKSECIPQAIQNMFARHGIYRSQKGANVGYEDHWFGTGNYIFFDKENSFYKELASMPDGATLMTQKNPIYAPGDEHYTEVLWAAVSDVQEKIRTFFDKFIQGDPATEELQRACENYRMQIFFHGTTDNPWRPSLGMLYDTLSVERYIISREIVATFYRGDGELFQRIRRCPECGDYFYAKDVRKTYCSEKCRNTMNNRNKSSGLK